MSKAMHAKPFRLTGPYTGRHARPESPRSKLIRAVSLQRLKGRAWLS